MVVVWIAEQGGEKDEHSEDMILRLVKDWSFRTCCVSKVVVVAASRHVKSLVYSASELPIELCFRW